MGVSLARHSPHISFMKPKNFIITMSESKGTTGTRKDRGENKKV